jgi:hypothetical protein
MSRVHSTAPPCDFRLEPSLDALSLRPDVTRSIKILSLAGCGGTHGGERRPADSLPRTVHRVGGDLSLPVSLSLCLWLSLCLSLSASPCLCLSLCLCFYPSISPPLSLCRTPSLLSLPLSRSSLLIAPSLTLPPSPSLLALPRAVHRVCGGLSLSAPPLPLSGDAAPCKVTPAIPV